MRSEPLTVSVTLIDLPEVRALVDQIAAERDRVIACLQAFKTEDEILALTGAPAELQITPNIAKDLELAARARMEADHWERECGKARRQVLELMMRLDVHEPGHVAPDTGPAPSTLHSVSDGEHAALEAPSPPTEDGQGVAYVCACPRGECIGRGTYEKCRRDWAREERDRQQADAHNRAAPSREVDGQGRGDLTEPLGEVDLRQLRRSAESGAMDEWEPSSIRNAVLALLDDLAEARSWPEDGLSREVDGLAELQRIASAAERASKSALTTDDLITASERFASIKRTAQRAIDRLTTASTEGETVERIAEEVRDVYVAGVDERLELVDALRRLGLDLAETDHTMPAANAACAWTEEQSIACVRHYLMQTTEFRDAYVRAGATAKRMVTVQMRADCLTIAPRPTNTEGK